MAQMISDKLAPICVQQQAK